MPAPADAEAVVDSAGRAVIGGAHHSGDHAADVGLRQADVGTIERLEAGSFETVLRDARQHAVSAICDRGHEHRKLVEMPFERVELDIGGHQLDVGVLGEQRVQHNQIAALAGAHRRQSAAPC